MPQIQTYLDFVGGPYDGYRHFIEGERVQLALVIELPVNPDVLWLINGQTCERRARLVVTRSIAVYCLDAARYVFVGLRTIHPTEVGWVEKWCRRVTQCANASRQSSSLEHGSREEPPPPLL